MKELTEKEQQAFTLRQEGKSHKEIAAIMGTTREPVRMWIAKARRKLGLPLWENTISPVEFGRHQSVSQKQSI